MLKAFSVILSLQFGTAVPGQFLPYVSGFGPAWLRGWILRQIPSKNIQRIIHIVDVLHKTSVEILREKQQDLEVDETVLQQTSEGRDIMSVLCKSYPPFRSYLADCYSISQ